MRIHKRELDFRGFWLAVLFGVLVLGPMAYALLVEAAEVMGAECDDCREPSNE